MKAIVIGATGLTGGKLVRELLEDNRFEEVIVFQRRESEMKHPKLKIFVLNNMNPFEIREEIKGDLLFNAMGTTLKKAGSKKEQQRIDRDIPVAFAKVASANGVKLMINISSIGASHQGGFYLKTKAEMEDGTSEAMGGSVLHFRPSLLMGKRDSSDFRIAESVSAWIMRIISPIMIGSLSKYRGMDTDILARAMIQASVNKGNLQSIFYYNDIVKIAKLYQRLIAEQKNLSGV